MRRFISKLCEDNRVNPRQRFASSQEQIIEMVAASLGVSLAGERLPTPLLLRRPFKADPDFRSVILTTVAGRQLGPTPALFLKLMRSRSWEATDPNATQPHAAAA